MGCADVVDLHPPGAQQVDLLRVGDPGFAAIFHVLLRDEHGPRAFELRRWNGACNGKLGGGSVATSLSHKQPLWGTGVDRFTPPPTAFQCPREMHRVSWLLATVPPGVATLG